MTNSKLGNDAMQEIRQSMTGLSGTDCKQTALRMADLHDVSWQHIYTMTKDLRPKSKTRADKGNRTFEFKEGNDVYEAVKLTIAGAMTPEDALRMAKANGFTNQPSLAYFQRLLNENGLGKGQRAKRRRGFRLWEAEAPGDIIQIDVTALKVRWEDEKTRRILRIEGVDKNHPSAGEDKVRVWQIMAVDDNSRRRFLRYVVATHITSRIMVEFCIELFAEWGVPKKIYTDNGSEFKGYFIRAAILLNLILESVGGFVHERHLPGNSQASGKVEVAHKWAEQMDRHIGVAINKGLKVTIETLNPFADNICQYYNSERVHRSTGQTPDSRWFSQRISVNKLPREIIESALLADEFDAKLEAGMIVHHKGVSYRIPGKQPYVNYIGHTVKIVVPLEIDLILIKLPEDKEFREIEKIIAIADKAGDFKTVAESNAEKLTKELKAAYKADNKEAKKKLKTTGETYQIPFYNHEIEATKTNVTPFPHQETIITPEEVAAVTPVPTSMLSEKEIGYWQAVVRFSDEFADVDEAKEFLLAIFPNEQGELPESEIEAAINNRQGYKQTQLRAVN